MGSRLCDRLCIASHSTCCRSVDLCERVSSIGYSESGFLGIGPSGDIWDSGKVLKDAIPIRVFAYIVETRVNSLELIFVTSLTYPLLFCPRIKLDRK